MADSPLLDGVDVVDHDGKVIVINADGRPLFALHPMAAEIFATRIVNAITKIKEGRKIFES